MADQFPQIGMPLPPPPAPAGVPVTPSVDRGRLRDLASRQRAAIIAGVANGIGGALLFTDSVPEGLGALLTLIVVALVIVAAFRLAQILHGATIGVLSAIAMLIPVVWIVVLVVLSMKASKELRAAGVHVGFFGANPNTV